MCTWCEVWSQDRWSLLCCHEARTILWQWIDTVLVLLLWCILFPCGEDVLLIYSRQMKDYWWRLLCWCFEFYNDSCQCYCVMFFRAEGCCAMCQCCWGMWPDRSLVLPVAIIVYTCAMWWHHAHCCLVSTQYLHSIYSVSTIYCFQYLHFWFQFHCIDIVVTCDLWPIYSVSTVSTPYLLSTQLQSVDTGLDRVSCDHVGAEL